MDEIVVKRRVSKSNSGLLRSARNDEKSYRHCICDKLKRTLAAVCLFLFGLFATNALQAQSCLLLYASDTTTSDGCMVLNWEWISPPVDIYGFTLYQWDNTLGDWQTASTNYDKTIQVLNVYPDIAGSNTLATWMHDLTIGLGKINVTSVTMTNFNANPNSYLQNSGQYIYDVIMFGSWDSNNGLDLNPTSSTAVRNFLNSGRGVLFGHDTYVAAGNPNFASLADKTNLYIHTTYSNPELRRGSEIIQVINDGYLLKYPHLIPYQSLLTIPLAHTGGQFAKGIVWMNFPDPLQNPSLFTAPVTTMGGGTNDFYLTTWNNAAMIQTGHSNGTSTLDERKVIANALWYLAQFTTDTTAKVCSARDIEAPEEPIAGRDTNNCSKIDMFSFDYGSTYSFYVKATNTTDYDDTCSSNTLTVENKSGLMGFFVLEDIAAVAIPDTSASKTFIAATDNVVASYIIQDLTKYIHIQAIDSVGNLSTVVTVPPVSVPVITDKTDTICSDNAFTVTLPSGSDIIPSGTTYTWTISSNANISGASAQSTPQSSISQTLENHANTNQSIIYTVTPVAPSGCKASTFTVTVTVTPKAVPSITIQAKTK